MKKYQTAESIKNPITVEMINEFFTSFEEQNTNLTLIEKVNKLKEYSNDYRVETVVYGNYKNLLDEQITKDILILLKGFSVKDADRLLIEVSAKIKQKTGNLIL